MLISYTVEKMEREAKQNKNENSTVTAFVTAVWEPDLSKSCPIVTAKVHVVCTPTGPLEVLSLQVVQ